MYLSKIKRNLKNKSDNSIPIVLICCGSFSPVTFLHLRMFEMAQDYFNMETGKKYEVIGGVLSPVSDGYHKSGLIPSEHRVEMCRLACKDHPFVSVDSWESDQVAWTPTLQVLERFKSELEGDSELNKAGIKVLLLVGSDLFNSIVHNTSIWIQSDVQSIIKDFGLVVIERFKNNDTTTTSDPSTIFESDLLYRNRAHIFTIPQPVFTEISSSKIRLLLSRGYSVKYLISDLVIEYIKSNKLYI